MQNNPSPFEIPGVIVSVTIHNTFTGHVHKIDHHKQIVSAHQTISALDHYLDGHHRTICCNEKFQFFFYSHSPFLIDILVTSLSQLTVLTDRM